MGSSLAAGARPLRERARHCGGPVVSLQLRLRRVYWTRLVPAAALGPRNPRREERMFTTGMAGGIGSAGVFVEFVLFAVIRVL
jgi:hypothetical protein